MLRAVSRRLFPVFDSLFPLLALRSAPLSIHRFVAGCRLRRRFGKISSGSDEQHLFIRTAALCGIQFLSALIVCDQSK